MIDQGRFEQITITHEIGIDDDWWQRSRADQHIERQRRLVERRRGEPMTTMLSAPEWGGYGLPTRIVVRFVPVRAAA